MSNLEKIKQMQKSTTVRDQERGNHYPMSQYETIDIHSEDGTRLSIDILKRKQAKNCIIFIPGTNAYTYIYNDYLFALWEKGHNVIAFDPRGHGKSGGTPGLYSIDELVQDTESVVQYVKKRWPNQKVFLSGSSQGGITAFYYSLKDTSIAGTICHNIADLSDSSSVELTRNPLLSRLVKPILPWVRSFLGKLSIPLTYYLDLENEPVQGFANAKQILYEDPFIHPNVSLKLIHSLSSTPPPRPIEELKVPIFVLQAGDDQIFRLNYFQRIFDRLKVKKELKVYQGLPHYMIVDHVQHYIDDVENWIQSCHDNQLKMVN
jgi:alpha-beta hydrolase superfamily lysophospholipase